MIVTLIGGPLHMSKRELSREAWDQVRLCGGLKIKTPRLINSPPAKWPWGTDPPDVKIVGTTVDTLIYRRHYPTSVLYWSIN